MNNALKKPELCPACRAGTALLAADHEGHEPYQVVIYCERDQALTVIERGCDCAPVVHTVGSLDISAALSMVTWLDAGERSH